MLLLFYHSAVAEELEEKEVTVIGIGISPGADKDKLNEIIGGGGGGKKKRSGGGGGGGGSSVMSPARVKIWMTK